MNRHCGNCEHYHRLEEQGYCYRPVDTSDPAPPVKDGDVCDNWKVSLHRCPDCGAVPRMECSLQGYLVYCDVCSFNRRGIRGMDMDVAIGMWDKLYWGRLNRDILQ